MPSSNYSIAMERAFGVHPQGPHPCFSCTSACENPFLGVKPWANFNLWSYWACAVSVQWFNILAHAHCIFYLGKFGLQRTGTYGCTYPLQDMREELTGTAFHGEGQPTKPYYCCYKKVGWTGRQRKTAIKSFRHYINLNNELRSAHYY